MGELNLSVASKPKNAPCMWQGTPVIFQERARIQGDVSAGWLFSDPEFTPNDHAGQKYHGDEPNYARDSGPLLFLLALWFSWPSNRF